MLTDTAIKAMKPKEKIYRKYDSPGLNIEIRPSGKRFFDFITLLKAKEKPIP